MRALGSKAGPLQIAAVTLANTLIVGGGVALAHRAIALAVMIGIVAFTTLTFAVAAAKPVGQRQRTND